MLLGYEPGSWSQPHTRQTYDLSTISLALKLGILREAAGGVCGTLALQGAAQMSQRDPCLTAALREAQAEHSESYRSRLCSPFHLPVPRRPLSLELLGHGARPDGKDRDNSQEGGKEEPEGGSGPPSPQFCLEEEFRLGKGEDARSKESCPTKAQMRLFPLAGRTWGPNGLSTAWRDSK